MVSMDGFLSFLSEVQESLENCPRHEAWACYLFVIGIILLITYVILRTFTPDLLPSWQGLQERLELAYDSSASHNERSVPGGFPEDRTTNSTTNNYQTQASMNSVDDNLQMRQDILTLRRQYSDLRDILLFRDHQQKNEQQIDEVTRAIIEELLSQNNSYENELDCLRLSLEEQEKEATALKIQLETAERISKAYKSANVKQSMKTAELEKERLHCYTKTELEAQLSKQREEIEAERRESASSILQSLKAKHKQAQAPESELREHSRQQQTVQATPQTQRIQRHYEAENVRLAEENARLRSQAGAQAAAQSRQSPDGQRDLQIIKINPLDQGNDQLKQRIAEQDQLLTGLEASYNVALAAAAGATKMKQERDEMSSRLGLAQYQALAQTAFTNNLLTENITMQNKIQHLEQNIDRATQEITRVLGERDQLQAQVNIQSQPDPMIQSVHDQQIQLLQTQNQKLNTEVCNLKSLQPKPIATLEAEKRSLAQELQQERITRAKAQTQINDLSKNLAEAKRSINTPAAGTTPQTADLQRQIHNLKSTLITPQEYQTRLRGQETRMKETHEKAMAKRTQMLNEKALEITNLTTQVADLKKLVSDLESQVKQGDSRTEGVQQGFQTIKSALAQQVNDLQSEVTRLGGTAAQQQQQPPAGVLNQKRTLSSAFDTTTTTTTTTNHPQVVTMQSAAAHTAPIFPHPQLPPPPPGYASSTATGLEFSAAKQRRKDDDDDDEAGDDGSKQE